ncbi:DUF1236 domain-containing protein, partial [Methylobacterium brachythecii]
GEKGGKPGMAGEKGGRDAQGERDGKMGKSETGERGKGEAGEKGGRGEGGGRAGGGERGGRGQAAGASKSLSTTQRTEFRSTITRSGARPLTNVNFNVSVGTAIPRSVRLNPLPATILTLVPAYRGYDYVLVGDDIVIIDPDTYEIIDVIPA